MSAAPQLREEEEDRWARFAPLGNGGGFGGLYWGGTSSGVTASVGGVAHWYHAGVTGAVTTTTAVANTQVALMNEQEEYYAPEMVEKLLRLDKQAPEAVFSNFKDMMDWLDRD